MSEKFRNPGPDKILSSSQDSRESAADMYLNSFLDEIENPKLEKGERQRTPEEKHFINTLITIVDSYLRRHDITPKLIVEERIKFFEPLPISIEQTEELGGSTNTSQNIKIYAQQNDFSSIAHTGLHEIIHAQSFISLETEVFEIEEDFFAGGATTRRFGLEILDSSTGTSAYKYLNEAMTEELALHIAEQEFPLRTVTAPIILDKNSAYSTERQKLNELTRVLYERNKELFSSEESVMSLLADAIFTGKILEFARILEKTFGKGSFRELGERFAERDPKIEDVLARAG
jgi:hypothetical protein